MLWRKSWLESRHLLFVAMFAVLLQFLLIQPTSMQSTAPKSGWIPIPAGEAARMVGDYRAWVWVIWIGRAMMFFFPFAAVIFAGNGITSSRCDRAGTYTLALPVRRRRLLAVRAGVGALEYAATALFACLLVPVAALAVGRSYPAGDMLVYAFQLSAGGMVLYGAAVLLTAALEEKRSKPAGLAFFFAVGFAAMARTGDRGLFRIMSGRSYLLDGSIPWASLAACVAAGAALIGLAAMVIERRDF